MVGFPTGAGDFYLYQSVEPAIRIQLSMFYSGYRRLFPPGVKRPEREADHLATSTAEVKMGGVLPPLLRMPTWLVR